jgi:hypothetical protein
MTSSIVPTYGSGLVPASVPLVVEGLVPTAMTSVSAGVGLVPTPVTAALGLVPGTAPETLLATRSESVLVKSMLHFFSLQQLTE